MRLPDEQEHAEGSVWALEPHMPISGDVAQGTRVCLVLKMTRAHLSSLVV